MKQDSKSARIQQIAEAAYALIDEKGYAGMSMLAVAKRAKASNETLYRWFGDKTGLFRALIELNAKQVTDQLTQAGPPGTVSLEQLGPVLLNVLLGDRAIALNRAAAADATGTLGPVLAEAGRGAVLPHVIAMFQTLETRGDSAWPAAEAAALWVDLLVGDWQIRVATCAMPAPDSDAIAERSARANRLCQALIATPRHNPASDPLVC